MRNFLIVASAVFIAAIAYLTPKSCGCAPDPDGDKLVQIVEATLQQHHLPGAAALVHRDGKFVAHAAAGVRALGQTARIGWDDRWHIGSDTKAFTATLIVSLSEQGKLRLEETLAEALPQLAARMNPAYRNITVMQLLSHASGLPKLTDDKDLPEFLSAISGSADPVRQRMAAAEHYLALPPASPMGAFSYSNLGYIIAGAIVESRMGTRWEDLVRSRIFDRLGMNNAGFGLPGTTKTVDQPHGHKETAQGLVALDPADPAADNPVAIAPAGSINITLHDWMLFAQDQLDGVRGRGKLLRPESYKLLHTPVTGPYALGWGVKPGPDGVPLLITHTGSNGYWIADIRIMPKKNLIVLFVANAGNEDANNAVQTFGQSIRDYFKPFD